MSELKAGRELDAMVAEHVMGWCYRTEPYSDADGTGWVSRSPDGLEAFADERIGLPYSTDIAAAWEVVEKMATKGYDLGLHTFSEGVVADFRDYEKPGDAVADGRAAVDPRDGGAPLAICLAALKAVGAPQETRREP